MYRVIVTDSMGREQFRMTVEAPLSRIEAELLPVLRAAYVARVEHVQEGGYAAIGSDGTRPVVWGVGRTEEEALEEGREEIIDNCEPHEQDIDLHTVAVTPRQMARIAAGEVSAQSLGLA